MEATPPKTRSRLGEEGLFVDRPLERIPQTQPRIRQAFQILRDLGLTIVSTEKTTPVLSELGAIKLASLAASDG